VATSRRSRVRPWKYIGSGFVLKMGWRPLPKPLNMTVPGSRQLPTVTQRISAQRKMGM